MSSTLDIRYTEIEDGIVDYLVKQSRYDDRQSVIMTDEQHKQLSEEIAQVKPLDWDEIQRARAKFSFTIFDARVPDEG